jgi:lipoprotein-anchoring transpeptidase ErfK/SrfK
LVTIIVSAVYPTVRAIRTETHSANRSLTPMNEPSIAFEVGVMPNPLLTLPMSRRRAITSLAAAGGLILMPDRIGLAAPIEPVESTTQLGSPLQYFPQTGHNLKGPFLTRWTASGGEAVLGIPLSEDRYAEGVGVVQTFQTVTLVYDPALESPWDVQAQHLPSSVRNSLAPSSARRKVTGCKGGASDCQFFEKSGHTISGRIAGFWNEHGDLPVFGLPMTEPFKASDTGVTTQVFERAVLEDRGSAGVSLRHIAAELAEADGLFGDPAFYPAPPTGGSTKLVKSDEGLRLRSGPSLEAEIIALLPDNAEFIAAAEQSGDWIGGYIDGYSGWVSADYLQAPPKLQTISVADWNPSIWQGAALGETNVRRQPSTQSDIVEVLAYGDEVTVSAWVKGEEVFTGANLWAQIGPDKYVYARNVGRNAPVQAPPISSDAPRTGRWVDVHLTQQLMTAYEDRDVVRVAVTTTGMAGWETPPGFYSILARVPNETMDSGAIGAEHFYKLEDVLFTQYFTNRGHAIHFAWWRTPETIGRPGSHGCLNLLLDDSQFFWEWAGIGTNVLVRTA